MGFAPLNLQNCLGGANADIRIIIVEQPREERQILHLPCLRQGRASFAFFILLSTLGVSKKAGFELRLLIQGGLHKGGTNEIDASVRIGWFVARGCGQLAPICRE